MSHATQLDIAQSLPISSKDETPLKPSIFYQCLAELFGTCFIVIIGTNSVHGAVLAQGAAGNFQVGMMFALAVMWGVYTAGSISGGHLNPSITVAIGLLRNKTFAAWKVPLYILSQVLGAMLGAALNYGFWRPVIMNFEAVKKIVRGQPNSDLSASLGFGVFPFPQAQIDNDWPADIVTPAQAMFIEAFGAGLLCFVVFMILDEKNIMLKNKGIAPIIIALTVGALIGILSPLTTGCFNPARDFGPRLIGFIAGWGRRAFPGKDNGFWVYWVGPILGAIIGGVIYDLWYSRAYSSKML